MVPCFNEEKRLDQNRFLQFLKQDSTVSFVLVDDGSSDNTLQVLKRLSEAAPDRIFVLALAQNQGKGEAVRRGLQLAIKGGAQWVGYWDADLATPLEEISRFGRIQVENNDKRILLGARIKRLGAKIVRKPLRHYMGRVFATLVSNLFDLEVYDTQCGAKIFHNSSALASALETRFVSKWIFDVELLLRLRDALGASEFVGTAVEIPLRTWVDVDGSKVRPKDILRSLGDLFRIYWSRS